MASYYFYFLLQDGNTPLHVAAAWGEDEAVEVLINHGADIKITNKVS